MNKSLGLTIIFWLNFMISPLFAYVINGVTFFQLFNSGTLPFVKPKLMPWLTVSTFIWILITSYICVGILTKKYFVCKPIVDNQTSKITVQLVILEIILLIIDNVLRLITEGTYSVTSVVNDIAVVSVLPLLFWLNYKFWKSNSQNWVFMGLIIQNLFVCLFMQGFYESVW
ncbi:hypothetical protein LBSP_05890 [Lentilactobacillus buchneri subsp. silagei]|uniref:hypothetical protein n=1 Tax=Lentilactobacillus buchneri TaxID=1581 RepID=UPI0012E49445|nr:hypothetical protein [Lentilactobacillus buchneri]GED94029.1 hypothetical protein LBSP_05890 [Lentilactobacillus buchneri subsp. silagei]